MLLNCCWPECAVSFSVYLCELCARECVSSWTGLHDKYRGGGAVADCKANQVKCSVSERRVGDLSFTFLHSGLDFMSSLMLVT